MEKGLSQLQLSEDVPSAKKSSISEWELKIRTPNLETTIDLAEFFGVSVGYMVGVDED